MLLLITLMSILPFLSSCLNNNTHTHVDWFISEFENEDFIRFKNLSITLKSKSSNKAVYILIKTNSNLPAYIITYDLTKKRILEIDHSMIAKAGIEDYFTDTQLSDYIEAFRKYDFHAMSVDGDGNVYMNPFYPDQPVCLMRTTTLSPHGLIQKGYLYEQYKGRWYLNISSMGVK